MASAVWRDRQPLVLSVRSWYHLGLEPACANKLPPPLQGKAKQDLHTIYEAENRRAANDAFDHFIAKYGARYDKAVTCLVKDREVLLTFYDFPAEH